MSSANENREVNMKERLTLTFASLIAAVGIVTWGLIWAHGILGANDMEKPALTQILQTRVAAYDSGDKPLAQIVLDLAYDHNLPLGFEYLDRDAVRRPLRVKLRDKTVQDILARVVGQLSEYRLDVSHGVVEIYSSTARANSSNLLNTVINQVAFEDQSPRMASASVFAALMGQLHVRCCEIGHILDSGHPPMVTLNVHGERVYQLLNSIVAQGAGSVWAVIVPPEKLSSAGEKLWEVYELGPGWEAAVLRDMQGTFPLDK